MDLQFLTDFAASSGLLAYYEYVKPYLFSILTALYLLYRLYERTKHLSQGDRTAAVPGSKVVDAISSQMFHSMVDAGGAETKLIVVDFYATWCGPCVKAAPIYEKLSVDYPDVLFLEVNVDKLKDVVSAYQVRAMPTFVLVKGGKEVDRLEGFSEPALKALLTKHK